jgi:uncharacterized protein (DUF1501 family)
MEKINRKGFLQLSALATSSLLIPGFLKGMGNRFAGSNSQNVLVILQLSGGNDGINTFIPYRDDFYYKNRPQLSYQSSEILKISDEVGFNPALTGLRKLYDNGDLCILNQVGYPNPDHSHFRSMDIWTTGSSGNEYLDTGWIGRYLDANCKGCGNAHIAIEVEDSLGLALKGENIKGLAISNPARIYKYIQDPFYKKLSALDSKEELHNEQASYLYKTMAETNSSVSYIYEKSKIYKSSSIYPQNNFGRNLKTIAELICSGSETKIYYLSISGFDTHARQKPIHERILGIVSESLTSFIRDLKKNDKFDSTMIMAFSEFGRRVTQNASQGTDHGEANNILLAGGALKKKGLYNKIADLEKLDAGNMKYQLDFRNIYATILAKWLDADDEIILGKKFELLNFV